MKGQKSLRNQKIRVENLNGKGKEKRGSRGGRLVRESGREQEAQVYGSWLVLILVTFI